MKPATQGNTIISMLHHYLAVHGMGKNRAHFHCDNCASQNKNQFLMFYMMYRVVVNKKNACSSAVVTDKNFKLLTKAKLPKLPVRLAKEAYFDPDIIIQCTVRGLGSHHAFPCTELDNLEKVC